MRWETRYYFDDYEIRKHIEQTSRCKRTRKKTLRKRSNKVMKTSKKIMKVDDRSYRNLIITVTDLFETDEKGEKHRIAHWINIHVKTISVPSLATGGKDYKFLCWRAKPGDDKSWKYEKNKMGEYMESRRQMQKAVYSFIGEYGIR